MDIKTASALTNLQYQLALKYGIEEESKDYKVLGNDLQDALSDVLDYCNRDDITGNMLLSVKDLYIIRRNQEGNEGETSRTEGGVSQTFEVGIPKKITSKLNRYRQGKMRSFQ